MERTIELGDKKGWANFLGKYALSRSGIITRSKYVGGTPSVMPGTRAISVIMSNIQDTASTEE